MKKIVAMLIVLAMISALPAASYAAGSGSDGVVTVSEDGLHIKVDFTKMENTDKVLGEIEAEDIGAIDMDVNYQIGFNDDRNVLFTINGYDPAWIIYEISAPKGQTLDTLVLKIYGRICDFSPIANAFAVFALSEGFEGSGETCELNLIPADQRTEDDWEDYAYYVQQANLGTMPTSDTIDSVHEFDLTEAAKGNKVMYVGIYQYTTNCPEWIEYQGLELIATAAEAPAATDAPTAAPTEEPAVTDAPAATDAPSATDEVKATDAPSDGDSTQDDAKKSGSKVWIPIVACVAVAAVVAAVIAVTKKKKS